jgi:hypothetical protein
MQKEEAARREEEQRKVASASYVSVEPPAIVDRVFAQQEVKGAVTNAVVVVGSIGKEGLDGAA